MKILIVATYAPDLQHSLTGFARSLRSELEAMGEQARLIAPRACLGRLAPPSSRLGRGAAGRLLGHADKLVLFPLELRRALAWADVVHLVDHGLAPYCKYLGSVAHLVTCHDLIALRATRGELPEWKLPPRAGRRFQAMVQGGLARAQHIACISGATRDDVLRLVGVPPERTTIVHDGLFHEPGATPRQEREAILARLGLGGASFLFHIGRNVPTKNRLGALRIFARLRELGHGELRLALAGEPLGAEHHALIREAKLQSAVHELPHLSDGEVAALYSGARALLFPSFYEGFGLPIIEAQASGCPVFTSDRAPMNEVGGKAARYFDPSDFDAAARMVSRVLASPDEVRQMQVLGYENIKRFSLRRMAQGYLDLYRTLDTPKSHGSVQARAGRVSAQ